MTPEAVAFLDKSRECLRKAEGMLARWPDEAGRAAYLAGLHAARAFIIERTGQVAKTHKGVQHELGRLTKDETEFGPELRSFLGRRCEMWPQSLLSVAMLTGIGVLIELVDQIRWVVVRATEKP